MRDSSPARPRQPSDAALGDPTAALIHEIFLLALERPPSAEDLAAWMAHVGAGLSLAAMAAAIGGSAEAQNLRARREAAKPSPGEIDELVRLLYATALGREPEPDDIEAWRKHVVEGGLTVAALVKSIAASPEAEALRARRGRAGESRFGAEAAEEIEALVARLFRVALARPAGPDDIASWTGQVVEGHLTVPAMVAGIVNSPEAEAAERQRRILSDLSDGRFVQTAFDLILGRGAMADEIAEWQHRLAQPGTGRDQLIAALFALRMESDRALADGTLVENPQVALVLGTEQFIGAEEWKSRAAAVGAHAKALEPRRFPSLRLKQRPGVLVSAIASLYKGGAFIERFLDNITSQTIFERCELIIVDADSPDNEAAAIERAMRRFPNILYHRAPTWIGIYEAWNIGVALARGRYLTNTNLDDLRREDSLERQAEILDTLPFVDVVYQDLFFSFDAEASFATVAAVGVQSHLPVITPYNLLRSNSPHNAPMWRRSLHEDVGLFDTTYRSAGDYEFWLRCVEAGKVFCKVNDPHVAYFVNPEGISTRPDTQGTAEIDRITRTHGRRIVSPSLVCTDEDFFETVTQALGEQPATPSRPEERSSGWRYAAVQEALRAASAASRAAGNEGR